MAESPFFIDFPAKEHLTNEDYIEVQKKLQNIDVEPIVKKFYGNSNKYTNYDALLSRISRGASQTLIDLEKGFVPEVHLEKIGNGGNRCIVSCVPFNRIYPDLIRTIPQALEKVGFNGYFYYRVGGFPNPTGKEIQYAGVPYSFKIFMMMEAQNLGFTNVLWIDSAAFPLRDPTPVFEHIEEKGAFIHGWRTQPEMRRYVFHQTLEKLKQLTGTNIFEVNYICTIAFGLKMDTELTQKLISKYYELVEDGLPFFACFPEEFVLTAILGQKDFKKLRPHTIEKFIANAEPRSSGSAYELQRLTRQGYYFYRRIH